MDKKRSTLRELAQGAGISAALVVAYLCRLVLGGQTPVLSASGNLTDDTAGFFAYAPGWELLKRSLYHGQSLLWSSGRNFGAPPAYEEVSASFFHPWAWFCNLFPYPDCWTVNAVGLMFILGFFHLLFGRKVLSLGWVGATVFAQLTAFNFFILRDLNHVYLLAYTGAFITFYFLCESLINDGVKSCRYWVGIFLGEALGAAWGLAAGFPEAVAPIFLVALLLWVFAFFGIDKERWVKATGVLMAASCLAVGLCCIPLWSFVEGLRLWMQDEPSFRHFPGVAGRIPLNQMQRFLFTFETRHGSMVFYSLGAVPLLLLFGSLQARAWKRLPRYFALSLGVSAAFFLIQVSHAIPPLTTRLAGIYPLSVSKVFYYYPPMAFLGVTWLLAGWVDDLMTEKTSSRVFSVKKMCWQFGLCFGLCVLLFFISPHDAMTGGDYARVLPLVCVMPFLVLFLRGFFSFHSRAVGMLLIAAIYAEAAITMKGFNYVSRNEAKVFSFGPTYEAIVDKVCRSQDRLDYRWLWQEKMLPDFCVNSPDSFASATPLKRNELLKAALFDRTRLFLGEPLWPNSLSVLGIKWLGANSAILEKLDRWKLGYTKGGELQPGWTFLELEDILPRAYLTQRCRILSGREEVARSFKDGRFRAREPLLEKDYLEGKGACSIEAPTAVEKVKVIFDSGDKVRLSDVRGPGLLVLNDSFYPGWKARDSAGNDYPIFPVNLAFRGIMLSEARNHTLEFSYEPPWLTAARRVTWLALLAFGLGFLSWIAMPFYSATRHLDRPLN